MKKALALLAVLLCGGCSSAPAPEGGASDWIDLMPGRDFKGWKRVPIDPLQSKAVWSHSAEGTLLCDGTGGVKEVLIHDEDRGDGVFHVEWRWGKKQDPTPNYNGGIYVRSSPDGKTWIQAQVAHGAKPPVVGDFIGMFVEDGKPKRVDLLQKGPSREAPMGEWNSYDITCKGKTITLSVNGGVTAVWEDCPFPKGRLGLQAEFAAYEFRSVKWKPQ